MVDRTTSWRRVGQLALIAAAGWLLVAPVALGAELETIFFENKFEAIEARAAQRLKERPADPEALAWRAEAAMKQGNFKSTASDLAALPKLGLLPALARGDFAWYTGNWATALAAYREARQVAPGNMHARWGESSALLHLERNHEALALAEQLLPKADLEGPSFKAWALVLRGASVGLQAQKEGMLAQIAKAGTVKADFEAALAVDAGNANALSALGRFYVLMPGLLGGDAAKGAELLERANRADPFFYLNHAYLVKALEAAGQADKAKAERLYYRAKFEDVPEAAKALNTLAPSRN